MWQNNFFLFLLPISLSSHTHAHTHAHTHTHSLSPVFSCLRCRLMNQKNILLTIFCQISCLRCLFCLIYPYYIHSKQNKTKNLSLFISKLRLEIEFFPTIYFLVHCLPCAFSLPLACVHIYVDGERSNL